MGLAAGCDIIGLTYDFLLLGGLCIHLGDIMVMDI